MRKIPLTQGKFALVDDEDYEALSKFKWFALRDRRTWYVGRNTPRWRGKQTTSLMHRVLLRAPTGLQVDHINGNGLDNRRSNIRLCTHQENARNQRTLVGGSSKFKGVSWYKLCQKWMAYIRVDDRQKYLGLFTDEIEAAKAYDAAALKYFGEFARLNFTTATVLEHGGNS